MTGEAPPFTMQLTPRLGQHVQEHWHQGLLWTYGGAHELRDHTASQRQLPCLGRHGTHNDEAEFWSSW